MLTDTKNVYTCVISEDYSTTLEINILETLIDIINPSFCCCFKCNYLNIKMCRLVQPLSSVVKY